MGFYTYMWLRENGTPYYVGKGTRKTRAIAHHRVGKCPPRERIIIQEFPLEEDALFAERFLITLYGREDLGQGCLLNLTDGGEIGPSGLVVPESVRQKHRRPKSEQGRKNIAAGQAARRAKGKWQKPHSEEVKRKISVANKGYCHYCPPRLKFCKRGHEMLEENICTTQARGRTCRLCKNLRQREYEKRKNLCPEPF